MIQYILKTIMIFSNLLFNKIIIVLIIFTCGLNYCQEKKTLLEAKYNKSHLVNNTAIKRAIKHYIRKDLNEGSIVNIVKFRSKKISDNEFDLFIVGSNFKVEQRHKNFSEYDMRGYTVIDNYLILLYGDIDSFFKKNNNVEGILDSNVIDKTILPSIHKDCYIYKYTLGKRRAKHISYCNLIE